MWWCYFWLEKRILVFGEKVLSGIMLMVLLAGVLTFAFNVEPVKASGAIYIRADGSVDPSTAPIYTDDNVTYAFIDDIYTDSVVIEKDDVVIDGNGYMLNGSVSGIHGFDISYRNNVTVKNTRITKYGDGIYVYHSNSCKVLDNILADCSYAIDVMHSSNNNTVSDNFVDNCYGGISVDYSSNDNTVANNTVTNSKSYGWGLYLWASSGNVFSNNIARNNSKGMDIRNAVNNTIHHNNISGNQRGIYLSYSSNNIISQNKITANMEVGIYILTHSSNNIISGNIITNNTYHGLELYENSANNSIIGNTVINNQYGIWLHHYSDYNYVAKNTVTNNTVGIRLSESVAHNKISGNDILVNIFGINFEAFADNNLIYHNNFIGNTQHIEHASLNVWDYGYPSGGNYWSDYVGVDVKSGSGQDLPGSDGIGDAPYIIDADNRDRYPLMNPYGSPPPVTYALTITVTVGGTTNPAPGTYSYTTNQMVRVTAIPYANVTLPYQFEHWELDGVNVGSANPLPSLNGQRPYAKSVFFAYPAAAFSLHKPSFSINICRSISNLHINSFRGIHTIHLPMVP